MLVLKSKLWAWVVRRLPLVTRERIRGGWSTRCAIEIDVLPFLNVWELIERNTGTNFSVRSRLLIVCAIIVVVVISSSRPELLSSRKVSLENQQRVVVSLVNGKGCQPHW